MSAFHFSILFACAVLLSTVVKLWLSSRQIRHVATHRTALPAGFEGRVDLASHQKAADYTVVKSRVGLMSIAVSSAILLGWTILGGLDALNFWVRDAVEPRFGPMAYQLALLSGFVLIGSLLDLPFELYNTFHVEQRFGFNRMTLGMYVVDTIKGLMVGALIGLPLAAGILWIMGAAGSLWWLWAWGAWVAFQLLIMVIFPTLIAPIFNKFTPLEDDTLKARVEGLMKRCGFRAKGFFVMDGSRRSAHANAYFTGLGASKRVVFFDTLLSKLTPGEVEAVLAHELGHFKHRHITKRLITAFVFSLGALALLGWLSSQQWFYTGLGVRPNLVAPNSALALLLFMLAVPVFSFFVTPLSSYFSRKHEFEADAYACAHAQAADLSQALLKLTQDNAATLTPDPVYVSFYYSHPPTVQRLAALPA